MKIPDPNIHKLGGVTCRSNERHGLVTPYDIKKEGKTAGQKKMTGISDDGSLNGFARNFYGQGNKQMEREFDRGILQAVRGWKEDGKEMTDGPAQSAEVKVSWAEGLMASSTRGTSRLNWGRRHNGSQ